MSRDGGAVALGITTLILPEAPNFAPRGLERVLRLAACSRWGQPAPGMPGYISTWCEPGLLILVSLADGPKHGYAMLEDIQQLAGVRLGPGTLYGALARLERLGLIAAIAPVERRRPYRLTEAGVTVLRSELASWQKLASAGLRRLEVPA